MRLVVIGGGAAGMMFSVQYKKQNPNDEVIVLEKTQYVSWAGCPTPYYIADELDFSHVVLNEPETFINKGIDVRINNLVTEINMDSKYLIVNNEKLTYDKLILAVGARVRTELVKGYSNQENVFTLSHAKDAVKIKEYINKNKPKKAVVIGLGFIGIEMVEALQIKGMEVKVVEFQDEIFKVLPENIRQNIKEKLESKNIDIKLNSSVVDIQKDHVITNTGEKIDADLILISTGITPNVSFLNEQIKLKDGKIEVDNHFKTSRDNVYAIGDCVYNKYYGTNEDIYAPFGDVANKHGMLLARHLSDKKMKWSGVYRSFSSAFYDLKFAGVGLNLEEAIKKGYDADILTLRAQTENSGFASYRPVNMSIIYDKKEKIVLGAFASGYEAVAQFIDQISVVIYLKTPIEEFINMDFAYSPKNSTVWTPLLVLYRKVIK